MKWTQDTDCDAPPTATHSHFHIHTHLHSTQLKADITLSRIVKENIQKYRPCVWESDVQRCVSLRSAVFWKHQSQLRSKKPSAKLFPFTKSLPCERTVFVCHFSSPSVSIRYTRGVAKGFQGISFGVGFFQHAQWWQFSEERKVPDSFSKRPAPLWTF